MAQEPAASPQREAQPRPGARVRGIAAGAAAAPPIMAQILIGAAAGVAVGIGIAYARKLFNERKDDPTSPLLDGRESVRRKTLEEVREPVPEGWGKPLNEDAGERWLPKRNTGDSVAVREGNRASGDKLPIAAYVKINHNGDITRIPPRKPKYSRALNA